MGKNLGRSAGFALALAMPGGTFIAALFAFGVIDGATAILAALAVLGLATLMTIALLVSLGAARAAIDRLLPDAAAGEAAAPGDRRHRLSLAARVIWPA